MPRNIANRGSSATLEEVLKSLVSPMLPVSTSLKRTVRQKPRRIIKVMVKINSVISLFSKLCNFKLSGVSINSYSLTGMLNVDEGTMHVDKRLKILQRQSILRIQNIRFIPVFLLSNTRTEFLFQNDNPVFINNVGSILMRDPRPWGSKM